MIVLFLEMQHIRQTYPKNYEKEEQPQLSPEISTSPTAKATIILANNNRIQKQAKKA